MIFENRRHAGQELAKRLFSYAGHYPLVLGIPRGGLPVGRVVADVLGGELDVVLVHKLRSPGNPEYAIGSIDEEGNVVLDSRGQTASPNDRFVQEEAARQLETIRRRRKLYTPARPPIHPADRIVIVVDDGLATGHTMAAALRSVRRRGPARLIMAVPVAPPDSLERIGSLADETACLDVQEDFWAISTFYEDFSPVTDEEAVRLLRRKTGVPT